MTGTFFWNGAAISFRPGETVASALERAGIRNFGSGLNQQTRALFCGIGQCQSCLVQLDGSLTEACLLEARTGMHLESGERPLGHD